MQSKELQFALKLADQASKMIADAFTSKVKTSYKSDNSPVTITDKAVNQLVIDQVADHFNGDTVLAEEGSNDTHSNRAWVCDPIDGTSAFTIGCPTGLFSLAFVEDGVVQCSVVADPYLDRRFWAAKGQGAYLVENGQERQLKLAPQKSELNGLMVGVSSSAGEFLKLQDFYQELAKLNCKFFIYSGVVHQMMNIAMGKLDMRVYNGPYPHDIAAAKLIVEEAGGLVTSRSAKEQRYDQPIDGAIIAAGPFADQIAKFIDEHDVRRKSIR